MAQTNVTLSFEKQIKKSHVAYCFPVKVYNRQFFHCFPVKVYNERQVITLWFLFEVILLQTYWWVKVSFRLWFCHVFHGLWDCNSLSPDLCHGQRGDMRWERDHNGTSVGLSLSLCLVLPSVNHCPLSLSFLNSLSTQYLTCPPSPLLSPRSIMACCCRLTWAGGRVGSAGPSYHPLYPPSRPEKKALLGIQSTHSTLDLSQFEWAHNP